MSRLRILKELPNVGAVDIGIRLRAPSYYSKNKER